MLKIILIPVTLVELEWVLLVEVRLLHENETGLITVLLYAEYVALKGIFYMLQEVFSYYFL